jgi:hypothetical protein
MTYWTMTDELARDIVDDVVGLRNETFDKERKAAAARYLAAREEGLSPYEANARANGN